MNIQSKEKKEVGGSRSHPIILALDTTSNFTSIALARGNRIVASFGAEAGEKRSERLWSEIDFLLTEAGLAIADVELFSVCVGPGGFTGLRVGIAAIKGFACATNRPVIGVSSLEAVAMQACPAPCVCAMINAYKGDVYSQLFSFDAERLPVAQSSPIVTTLCESVERASDIDSLVFAGSGAIAHIEAIKEIGKARLSQQDAKTGWIVRRTPEMLADQVARVAFLKYRRGHSDSAESLQALYVRPAEAEIKLSLGLVGSKQKRAAKLNDAPPDASPADK